MPRKPQPPIMITMDRAQKRPVAAPLTTDGERLVGARAVPLDQVVPDPGQPRRDWIDEEAVADLLDLANSLKDSTLALFAHWMCVVSPLPRPHNDGRKRAAANWPTPASGPHVANSPTHRGHL